MKNTCLKIVTALAVLFITHAMQAYERRVENKTSKNLLVNVAVDKYLEPSFQLIQPGAYVDFIPRAPFAPYPIYAIEYIIPDEALLKNTDIIKDNKVDNMALQYYWLSKNTNAVKKADLTTLPKTSNAIITITEDNGIIKFTGKTK